MTTSKFKNVYLFHGRAGSPNRTSLTLEKLLKAQFPEVNFIRPLLKHSDGEVSAKDSFRDAASRMSMVEPGSLIVGVSMGGLIACALQERFPLHNLSVFTVSSPTSMPTLSLSGEKVYNQRVALYSSLDPVVGERVADWPNLTNLAFDVPWMKSHNTEDQKVQVAMAIAAYMSGNNLIAAVESLS